jgi:hypothetical protein
MRWSRFWCPFIFGLMMDGWITCYYVRWGNYGDNLTFSQAPSESSSLVYLTRSCNLLSLPAQNSTSNPTTRVVAH